MWPELIPIKKPRACRFSVDDQLPRTRLLAAIFLLLIIFAASANGNESGALRKATKGPAADYPSTPEAVVEAFAKASLRDLPDDVELDVNGRALREPLLQFSPTSKEWHFIRKKWGGEKRTGWAGPVLGPFDIATGFRIVDVRQADPISHVTVRYDRIGRISPYHPFFLQRCRGNRMRERDVAGRPVARTPDSATYRENPCKILAITTDNNDAKYCLVRLGDTWRIVFSYEQPISLVSAVKLLRFWTAAGHPNGGAWATETQVRDMLEYIRILQEYKKSERAE